MTEQRPKTEQTWDDLCKALDATDLKTELEKWIREAYQLGFRAHLLRDPQIEGLGTRLWLKTIRRQSPAKLEILGRLMMHNRADDMLQLIGYEQL